MSRLLSCFFVIFLFFAFAVPVFAGTSTFNMYVKARIPIYTSLLLEGGANANQLNISDASNERVIVDQVGSMNIRSNAPNGFSLSITSLNGFYLVRPGESSPAITPSNANFFKYAIRFVMGSGTVYTLGPSPYSSSVALNRSSGFAVTGNILIKVGIMLAAPEFGGPRFVAWGTYRDRITITMSAL